MKNLLGGSGSSLLGVAILAACACGTSSNLVKMTGVHEHAISRQSFYLPFVVVGLVLIVQGLWRRGRRFGLIALGGAGLMIAGNLLVEQMSITASTRLTVAQLSGLLAYVGAGALLVLAFYRAFPSQKPGASLTAMAGMGMATGCNCCLVAMGITGLALSAMPFAPWLGTTEAAYIPAAVLIAVGLGRLGGPLPAIAAIAGQAVVFFGLRLVIPGLQIAGNPAGFLIKYPLMLFGTVMMMTSFAWAYRASEATEFSRLHEPVTAGD